VRGLAALPLLAGMLATGIGAAPSASAAEQDVLVVATAGFVDQTAPPQPAPAQGDLAVARTALGEQARAVVLLDIPVDSTAATVTFRASGQPGSSYGTSSVSACRVTAPWKPGAGQAMSAAPSIDCTGAVPVVAGGAWTFDLGPMVKAWAEGAPSLGIALVDATSLAPAEVTFNIVGSEHVGTYVGPDPVVSPPPAPTPAPQPAPEPAVRPVVLPQLGPVQEPQVTPVLQPPVAPPAVAPAVPRARPVAVVAAFTPLRVRPELWLLLPFVLAFLVALRRATSADADGPWELVPS
jgi:hypothetical protein